MSDPDDFVEALRRRPPPSCPVWCESGHRVAALQGLHHESGAATCCSVYHVHHFGEDGVTHEHHREVVDLVRVDDIDGAGEITASRTFGILNIAWKDGAGTAADAQRLALSLLELADRLDDLAGSTG